MSDEKSKPFAQAFPPGASVVGGSGAAWPSVSVVGGRPWLLTGRFSDVADLVNVINDVVEQREAKLRAVLLRDAMDLANRHADRWKEKEVEIAHRISEAPDFVQNDRDHFVHRDQHQFRAMASVAREIAEDIAKLGLPEIADYVPAEHLRAEQEKVRQLQAAIDALDGATADTVRAFLEASGLRGPDFVKLSERQRALRDALLAMPLGRT